MNKETVKVISSPENLQRIEAEVARINSDPHANDGLMELYDSIGAFDKETA